MTNRPRDQQAAPIAKLDRSPSASPRRDRQESSLGAWVGGTARRPGRTGIKRHSEQPSPDVRGFVDRVVVPALLGRLLRERQSAA